MRITIKDIKNITESINKLFGYKKFEIGERNGFIYFDYVDCSKDSEFANALSTKAMFFSLQAFRKGIIQGRKE